MHRQPLLNMLVRYKSHHPEEAKVADRICHLITTSPDCFERHCRPGHITASAWVLSRDHRRSALVLHRKLNRWLQPGGHADGNSDVVAVALKEVHEETGLTELERIQPHGQPIPFDIDIHRIPARVDPSGELLEDAHDHHDLRFLFRATSEQPLVLSEESHEVRWFSRQEIMDLTQEESVLRMLRKAEAWGDAE